MTIADQTGRRPVGELLRGWRERRRLSQLDLANTVEVSTRHLSFVETGRSMPSREMVLRLAEQLEVPLRDRNQLLLAAGYAPVYGEASLHSPSMLAIRGAVRRLLAAHEPYPALVVDRWWHLVEANAGIRLLLGLVSPELQAEPVNVLRATLHPDGLAPHIANLGEWRAHILGRLHRQVVATADPELQDLYDELRAYPCDEPEPLPELPGPGEVVVPLRLRLGDAEQVPDPWGDNAYDDPRGGWWFRPGDSLDAMLGRLRPARRPPRHRPRAGRRHGRRIGTTCRSRSRSAPACWSAARSGTATARPAAWSAGSPSAAGSASPAAAPSAWP